MTAAAIEPLPTKTNKRRYKCRLCNKIRSHGEFESHLESSHYVSISVLTNDFQLVQSLFLLSE